MPLNSTLSAAWDFPDAMESIHQSMFVSLDMHDGGVTTTWGVGLEQPASPVTSARFGLKRFEQKRGKSMGRRKRQSPLSEALLDAPWWVSAALAFASYIGFHAILPASLASNPFLIGLAMVSRSLAWVPAAIFGFLGLLAYLRARKRQTQAGRVPGGAERRERILRAVPDPGSLANKTPKAKDRIGETPPVVHQMAPSAIPEDWSLDALRQLEWKRFETLCVWYYEAMGFAVKTVPHGADGGIDATLYKDGLPAPIAVVQCKAWRSPVRVEPVRALGGVMHSNKVKRGVFWSLTGYIGQPVQTYAAEAGIQLLDGPAIVERIRALDADKQIKLLARAFEGDYQTPTCAACGVKMVERQRRDGSFWGCRNYSKGCRFKLARAA
ncbi:restriction endonuclease [Cupriavidus pinatubonensis]|uniref:restriction endonuclease n=1 Tax=Cupriavidus pinatubonensis TaxID=248026 RepID=UPI002159CCDF|nr:restriction endonuclease [Cupriavidus pinatubonensis]